MNGSNRGSYIPRYSEQDADQQMDQSYPQQHQHQHQQHLRDIAQAAQAPHIGGDIGASSVSFGRDDEALRLLQQLAAEQSELLEQLHAVNSMDVQATAVMRPTEQYLTIAINGKHRHRHVDHDS